MAEEFLNPLAGYSDLPEGVQKVSLLTSGVAGIASGIIKIPKGIASLAAELIDLGADTNTATSVEQFFDGMNPFEEVANQRLSGRLTEALVQIGVPSAAGAKVATKLAEKALKAKRSGAYVDLANPNLAKGVAKADELNKLSTSQRFGAIAVGGAAGETLVADVEKLGTIGSAFGIGPTQLDEYETEGREDATRKLMNRFKFGSESLLVTPVVYGIGSGIKKMATLGETMAYSDSKLDRFFFKAFSTLTPQGERPREQFLVKEVENAAKRTDVNLAMEQVQRIDKEVNALFPETNKFFNAASKTEKNQFLETLDKALFSGKLDETIDKEVANNIIENMTKRGAKQEGIDTVLTGIDRIRNEWTNLISIASKGTEEISEGLMSNLKSLMGERLKTQIGNTYAIFENKYTNMFNKFKPTQDSVDKVKQIFIRYASKNGKEITDLQAQSMVDNILEQAKNTFPRADALPSFKLGNLSIGATDPYFIKTFSRTVEKDMAGGLKELEVIGQGSKAFRDLFGKVDDVRTSIYEGMNRLSVIARKNQMYDDILNADLIAKSKVTAETPFGKRGFFHDSELEAQAAFGTNVKIVPIDKYIKNDFKGGGTINALQNKWTTETIAEGFSNTSKIQEFMRGETGGTLGKTFSWAYRNLILVPKAISQYSKTILSVPTQIKNFLANGAFALSNGTVFESPEIIAQAIKKSGFSVQLGNLSSPLSADAYRRYLKLGLTESNPLTGDLGSLLKDTRISADGNIGTDSLLKPLIKSLGKTGEMAQKGLRYAERLYTSSDDAFKIFNFEVELARRSKAYSKAGIKKTAEELDQEVAEIVKNTMPNYARVGEFVRASRMLPFGNFMSFPSEIFRTGTGIAQQILKDLRDPITGSLNPITSTNIMKDSAMKRLIGSTVALGALPYGVVEGSKAIFGISDEEAKAASDFVAPWSKDSQKIYMRNPDTNELYFVDWSKMNSYDTLQRPFATLLRNLQEGVDQEKPLMDGFIKGVAEAAGNIASPFVDPSIYTQAFLDVTIRGGRTKEGKELYTSETPTNERVTRTIGHLTEAFYPSYKPFTRTYQALTEQPGRGGEKYEVPYELAGIFGLRAEKIDPLKSMGFYITDLQEGERNSRREFTGGPEGTLSGEIKTPKDLIERYFVANKALFGVQQGMSNHLKNAQTLGIQKSELAKLFDSRGLAVSTLYRLDQNRFEPFFPSEGVIEKFNEISRTTGQPNPFIEAQGTLQNMRNKLRSQNLSKPFNVDLKNYLPSYYNEGSPAAAPLNTPMPNASILTTPIQQVAGLQNGLTPTENALLSESEKQMRLKQRGLA